MRLGVCYVLKNYSRQHRTIPALRLKHRSGSCGTASALPKCSIMSGCGTRIVLRGQKPLALCDRCPCFGSLFPPLAALTFAASSIICAFGLASAAPRSPYRHLELCGIASKIKISSIGASTVREISTVSCALAQFSVQRLSISAWDILPSKKNPKKPKNKKNAKGKLPRSAGKPRTPATLKRPATLKIQAACREFSPSVCTGARQVLYCLQNPCERKKQTP